jgi:thiol-disulfide isomerase/thioredoxin
MYKYMDIKIIIIVLLVLVILHLTKASWAPTKDKVTVMWFYSDSCSHCTNMKGAWDEFVGMKPAGVELKKIDTATNQALSQEYKVDGVPFIVREINGNRTVYQGDRSAKDLYKFATEHPNSK